MVTSEAVATNLYQTSLTVPPQHVATPKPPLVATSSVDATVVPAPFAEQKLTTVGINMAFGQASLAGCAYEMKDMNMKNERK